MQTLPDASQWLLYFPEHLDTRKALWYCDNALDVYELKVNAATLGAGATLEDLRSCEPFLSSFPAVFLAISDRHKLEAVAEAFAEFAPCVPILKPAIGAFRDHPTVCSVMASGGQRAVDHLMIGAEERPAAGLLDLATVERQGPEDQPYVLSGIRELDRSIGGFYGGELSVWTGRRGGGKSTLLGQLLLNAVDQGHVACCYSGELAAWRFKSWVLQQAAGPTNVIERQDRFSERIFYTVPPAIQRQIDEWWRGRFLLYDNRLASGSDEDSIIRIFEYAVRRHGACIFLLDNLMTARFSTSSDRDFYRAQSNFTGRLVEFAKKHECHVHLVCHPRKGDSSRSLEADDVGGSGEITNRADNVFSLERLSPEEEQKKGFCTALRVLKNRSFGETIGIALNYDVPSRRFYPRSGDPNRRYMWEFCEQQTLSEEAGHGS